MGKQIKKKPFLIISTAIIVLAAIIVILYPEAKHTKNSPLSKNDIANLAAKEECNKETLQATSKLTPNTRNKDFSITLLSYRANCYYKQGRYQEAINDFKELAHYYELGNNKEMAELVKDQISDVEGVRSSKPANVPAQPDADPALVKAIQRL